MNLRELLLYSYNCFKNNLNKYLSFASKCLHFLQSKICISLLGDYQSAKFTTKGPYGSEQAYYELHSKQLIPTRYHTYVHVLLSLHMYNLCN